MKSLARIVTLIVILFLAACNLPGEQATSAPSADEQAATIVAATMQAVVTVTPVQTTPFASPVAPVITPTTKPTFRINTANAECRSGPGADFTLIATFAAGTTVDLAGKSTAESYYIVVDPTSHNLCWVPAQDGAPAGDTGGLLEVTPPASSISQKVPARPSFVGYTFNCEFATGGGVQVKVDLTWPDAANNEKGYYVYRDGTQIADLPANSTSYSETTSIDSGVVFVYSVAAYNDAGSSAQVATRGDPITCH